MTQHKARSVAQSVAFCKCNQLLRQRPAQIFCLRVREHSFSSLQSAIYFRTVSQALGSDNPCNLNKKQALCIRSGTETKLLGRISWPAAVSDSA